MVNFINEKAGTQRNSDGSLKPTAGRIDSLDEIITNGKGIVNDDLITKLKTAVDSLEGSLIQQGKAYIATAEKILSKGGLDYVEKEIKRLEGMIKGGNIKPSAKGQFQLKQNLLKAFLI